MATAIASLTFGGRVSPPRFGNLHTVPSRGVGLVVKPLISSSVAILVAASLFAGTALADPTANQAPNASRKLKSGRFSSPVRLSRNVLNCYRSVRRRSRRFEFIDRHEIDWTGRQTTPGALVNEPSVRIIGH